MADYSEDVARYAADKAGADYDAAVAAGHTPQTIIQDALGNGHISHEDLARYAADKSGADYDAATAAGHTPQTILQQTTGYKPAQASNDEHLFDQEFRSSPEAYLSGAELGALTGAKVAALKTPAELAWNKFTKTVQGNNPDTPWGLQAYANTQAGHTRPKNVSVPISEFEKIYGQPITQSSEFQDFLKVAKNPTGVAANPLQQKYQQLLTNFQSPTASPQVMQHLAGKGFKAVGKAVMPILSGANAAIDLQDALDRFEAGETGRGIIGAVGAGSSAAAPFASAVPYVGPALATGLAATGLAAPLVNMGLDTALGHKSVFEKKGINAPYKSFPQGHSSGMKEGGSTDDAPFDPEATYHDDSQSALSQIADYLKHTAQNTIDQQKMVEDLHNQAFGDPKNPMQITDHDAFNKLVDHYGSAVPVGSIEHTGLDFLNKLRAAGRTPIVPVPNRWFSQPDNPAFEKMQGMVNKVLDFTKGAREDFHSGAFVDPRTGEVLDSKMMHDVGVIIDPNTGRPVMSAQGPSSVSSFSDLDPKTGTITKSNLVRRALYKPVGGDPILDKANFIATIEKGGAGHKYGLGMDYATPTEMYNTMTGANPTLRPKSRGDIFGMGDVVGRVQIGQGPAHDVYEKLLVAPRGSDVPGVKLNKKEGGHISEMKAALKMKNGGLYENIHAKQERIAHGSGEHMRKPGSAGAPSEQDFIESAKTAKMKEGGLSLSVGRGEKLPVSQGAGLTAKGREKYNRETGSHLQAPQPEGGARKDSFCARMQGVVDHAKGDAERAKASLKRWKC